MKHATILLALSGALCASLCSCGSENAAHESQAASRSQTPTSVAKPAEPLTDGDAGRMPVLPPPPSSVPIEPRDIDTRPTDPVGTDATVTTTPPKPKPTNTTPVEEDAGMSDSLTQPVLPPPQTDGAALAGTTLANSGSKKANADTAASLGSMDTEFIKKAMLIGLFEVRSSELAVTQATTPFVREFAQMMIVGHGEANRDLEKLARRKGGVVPVDLDEEYQSRLSTLRDQQGVNFDRQYHDMQVTAHKDAIALFDRASANCEDDELKAYATKVLPTLREHQKKLNEMPPTNGG